MTAYTTAFSGLHLMPLEVASEQYRSFTVSICRAVSGSSVLNRVLPSTMVLKALSELTLIATRYFRFMF